MRENGPLWADAGPAGRQARTRWALLLVCAMTACS